MLNTILTHKKYKGKGLRFSIKKIFSPFKRNLSTSFKKWTRNWRWIKKWWIRFLKINRDSSIIPTEIKRVLIINENITIRVPHIGRMERHFLIEKHGRRWKINGRIISEKVNIANIIQEILWWGNWRWWKRISFIEFWFSADSLPFATLWGSISQLVGRIKNSWIRCLSSKKL